MQVTRSIVILLKSSIWFLCALEL